MARSSAAAAAAALSWWDLAACQTVDPELFFPVSESGPAAGDISRAKAVCASCRVRAACLSYALRTRQMDGVWGGYSAAERSVLAAQRQLHSASAS